MLLKKICIKRDIPDFTVRFQPSMLSGFILQAEGIRAFLDK